MSAMPGKGAPIPDSMLAHIRQCVRTEHAAGHMAPQWQLAIDHRRWLLAENDRLREELEAARRPDPFAELDEETNKVIRDLMYAYRHMITAAGSGRPAEVLDLERTLDRLLCQCCVFGNHDIRCSCDGAECCHPEMYLEYNPEWGHGKDWAGR